MFRCSGFDSRIADDCNTSHLITVATLSQDLVDPAAFIIVLARFQHIANFVASAGECQTPVRPPEQSQSAVS